MLEIGINDVVKNFGFKNVLDGVSFEVMTGERVALVGRNGTGKTTILKIIAQKEKADRGQVSIHRGATIGYLEQIPQISDNYETVEQLLTKPFAGLIEMEQQMRETEIRMSQESDPDVLARLLKRYSHLQEEYNAQGGYEIEERIGRVVTGFGLGPHLKKPFSILSGGEKTIVMLASTILSQPDLLLLDEPTNHLDMATLEWFEGYLAKYRGTLVMVSHDRYFLDRVATKTILLEQGETTVFHGNYTFALKEQERLLLAEFESYKNQQKKLEAMHAAIKRYREWGALNPSNPKFYRKAKELEARIELMEPLKRPQIEKPHIPIAISGGRTGKDVMRLEAFSLAVDHRTLINSAEFTLFFRDRMCLMGANGTGKTTFIRALLGEADYSGTLFVTPSARIGYIPQEIRFPDDTATVVNTFRLEYPCTEGQARNILARYFFFGESVFKQVRALSGGEKVLLKLAILVQQEINFLVLDEPTNHIDIDTRQMLEESLAEFGGTLLFVSHDRYFIQTMASRLLILEGQRLTCYEGMYEDYRVWKSKNQ
jgi:ATP-binding cassette, subfamily F, member 3